MTGTRRDFLTLSGLGVVGVAAARLAACEGDTAPDSPALFSPFTGTIREPEAAEALARWILETPTSEVLDGVVGRLGGGLSIQTLFSATLLAGLEGVPTHPIDGELHTVYACHAAYELSLGAPLRIQLEPLLWAIHRMKTGISRVGVAEPMAEIVGALPEVSLARPMLQDALDAEDVEVAERAALALWRARDGGGLRDILYPFMGRDLGHAFHKVIFARHAFGALGALDAAHGEILVRKLISAALAATEGSSAWAEQRARISDAAPEWVLGERDDAAVPDIVAALRSPDPIAITASIIDFLEAGIAPATIWDAIRLGAAEKMLFGSFGYGRHWVTALNAYRRGYEVASSDEARLEALVMAASVASVAPVSAQASTLVGLGSEQAAELGDIFGAIKKPGLGSADTTAPKRVLGWFEAGGESLPLFDFWRQAVFATTFLDYHDYKVLLAALEEASHISPRWRPHFIAGTILHAPGTRRTWDNYTTIRDALEQLWCVVP